MFILKAPTFCGPEQESCVLNQTLKDNSCLVSCDGFYADIADDSLQQKMIEGAYLAVLLQKLLQRPFKSTF